MKILLLKDVPKVGRKYEVKEVADGFARNSLFPRKLAEPATRETEARITKLKQSAAQAGEVAQDLLVKNLEALDGKTVTIRAKANEKGHLFQGIHKGEILNAIKKELGLNIREEALVLEKAIKEVGDKEILTATGKDAKKAKFILRLLSS